MNLLRSIWYSSKRSRTIPVGPVSIIYKLGRTVRVSSNGRRRLARMVFGTVAGDMAYERSIDLSTAPLQVPPSTPEPALVVGVGPGLGFAVALKLACSGMPVALSARNAERLDPIAHGLTVASGQCVRAYGCNATDEFSVRDLMAHVVRDMGVPELVIYAVQGWYPGRAIDTEPNAFEECWRQNCFGAFIVAREAARRMAELKRGTIVFVGSTSGLVGRANHLNLVVGKFGLRGLSQVLARELWPDGIHVVHLIIDADITGGGDRAVDYPQSNPDDLAELIYALHRQPRSAWTSEIDVRPWNERFWEHC